MRDFREQNFYELLDVHPQASQQELDRAYQRARRIFNPDSVATYALFQPDELNLLRRRIEEAFRTLSDPERRAAYDQELARLDEGWSPAAAAPAQADGVEDQDAAEAAEALAPELEAVEPALPVTEEPAMPEAEASAEALGAVAEAATASPAAGPVDEGAQDELPAEPMEQPPGADGAEPPPEPEAEALAPAEEPEQAGDESCACPPSDGKPEMPVLDEDTEVTGAILLQARLAKGLSLDDYVQVTKISIYYLRNLENENFSDLPATVYIQGYLRQMAQLLGLDPKRVSVSYLERKARLEAEQGK